ncbi:hypothetical protein PG996_009647 [Apiospora saccharicola]|uniref:F-box domain-containing protein n=1 Tax=Apiospora saccharicola TaxID=335842 RepID=A0ABR1ULD8_9PEZI
MVRHALPNLQSREPETRAQYAHWCKISERGQKAVSKLIKDPDSNALGTALAEMANFEPQKPPHLRPRNQRAEGAFGAAAMLLPDFLRNPAPSASSAPQDFGNSIFMKLPLEVRNMIYDHCVFYPSARELYRVYYTQRISQVQRSTPTIYLLSKQITREALLVLRSRVLVIDRVPPWPVGRSIPLDICNFISRDTLLKVRYLELRVAFGEGDSGNGDVWLQVVKDLLSALASRNSIIELKVLVKIHGLQIPYMWSAELKRYEQMVQQVCFEYNESSPDFLQLADIMILAQIVRRLGA